MIRAGTRLLRSALDTQIDEAARDGRKTFHARVLITFLLAVVAATNIDIAFALVWAGLIVIGEFVIDRWLIRYFRRAEPATLIARAVYTVGVFTIATLWTAMPLVFWFADIPGVSASAIVILATLIIHAEAFAFRSVTVLVAAGGPPAAALIMLPWIDAAFTGIQATTFAAIAVLAIGYAGASVRSHRATARSLHAAQDELERFAYYDALTSLANRRWFTDHLRKLIMFSERRGTRFALLLIDLDQFKQVNDTLGHDAGDALLVAIGERLRAAVRPQDDVARLGGDEFAILLSEADDRAAIDAVCERVAMSCDEAFEFNGAALHFSLSVGFAVFPDNGDRQDSLYKSADLALYQAKQSGRNTWRYSKETLSEIASRARFTPPQN